MRVNCLAMTGVPGWLTAALFEDLARECWVENGTIRALVHPSFLVAASNFQSTKPLAVSFHPYDLARGGEPDQNVHGALRGADVLVHSAAVIHVHRTADWYRINTEGTLRLAREARSAGVQRFVFISSNAAGGRCSGRDHVLTEKDRAEPKSHYGRSKLMAEQGLMEMHEAGSFEIVILRPSMFYGPPVPDRHIDIYRRILQGRMPIIGSGEYRRSITYIDNLVQATRLAATQPKAAGEVFYVVDEPVYTTRGIAEAMAAALGVQLRSLRLPALAGPIAYWADRLLAARGLYWQNLHLVGESHWHVALSCQKLKDYLGYSPKVSLEDGMRRAVEWCRREGKL